MRDELKHSTTVTEVIYGAGYNSNSRFYEQAQQMPGMTPSDYCSGGANSKIRFAIDECTLDSILAAISERGVCKIALGDNPEQLARDLQETFPEAELIGATVISNS